MLSGEAENISFIVLSFGRTPDLPHTWGEHVNHYAYDAVSAQRILQKPDSTENW